jgi:Mn2+/Fe2+ NRAMP family transporter
VLGGLALLGTTLTSYVYVWETVSRGPEVPPDESPDKETLTRTRIGAVAGAVFTAVILWFMLVASAATLGQHHGTVSSVQDAAAALGPLAGSTATDLFALGLITSAVVALPVLMATTAYVVGAQFDWRGGLSEGVGQAQRFYGILAAFIGLGLDVRLAGVSVVAMLVAASVIVGLGPRSVSFCWSASPAIPRSWARSPSREGSPSPVGRSPSLSAASGCCWSSRQSWAIDSSARSPVVAASRDDYLQ